MFLSIKNLSAVIDGKTILDNFSLNINEGEIHAIMGPNGCGKSTLANVLAGKEDYEITSGEVVFKNHNLLDLNIEERSQLGIFLAFQYPIEIPGVNITPFLKASLNAKLKKEGKPEVDALSFAKELKQVASDLGIKSEMLSRSVNEGFSGGEKKRYEILQMSILKPCLAILDETDSGLDVDAMKLVSEGVNSLRDAGRGFLVITHYQRLLDHIKPDVVHIMANGRIVKTGGPELALEVENNGYSEILAEVA